MKTIPAAQKPQAKAWQKLLERHNLKWSHVSNKWDQGAFAGNGLLGFMVYKLDEGTYRWELGRTDVMAHFQFPKLDWADPRVLLGDFILKPEGKIISEKMELELWNAQVIGEIQTDQGTIKWRSFVHATKNIIVIETEKTEGEYNAVLDFRAVHRISPCLHTKNAAKFTKEFIEDHLPPKPELKVVEHVHLSSQPFFTGGQSCIAWKKMSHDARTILYGTITNSYPEVTAEDEALELLKHDSSTNLENLVASHREWWHKYYQQSFLSMNDTFWEGFYWIQMYKLGSATRPGKPLIDTQGPWLTQTPWPTTVWNLNVELSYSPVYTSNRLEIGKSLCETLTGNIDQLVNNVPEKYRPDCAAISRASSCINLNSPIEAEWEVGNLMWACHNYYRQCAYSMDKELMLEGLYPLLTKITNFYMAIMEKGEDGKYHLPPTQSPEFKGNFLTKDTNYDLAMLRWGCQTLCSISDKYELNDKNYSKWSDTLENLVEYSVDDNGMMVGIDQPFNQSHRHFSHIIGIFPLNILGLHTPEMLPLIHKSIEHWISFEGALQGYSFTGASSMYSSLGDGEKSLKYLNGLIPYLTSNTMYVENGPVIETPLSGAESIHNMLLQSWNGIIKVFPAVSEKWQNISFADLRTEGAFLISAKRENGKTKFVKIESLVGGECKIQLNMPGKLKELVYGLAEGNEPDGTKINTFAFRPGQTFIFTTEQDDCSELELCDANKDYTNYFGMEKSICIEPNADGNVVLNAPFATIAGMGAELVKNAESTRISNWKDTNTFIKWSFTIPVAGDYDISLTYAAGENEGGICSIKCEDKMLEFNVVNTGGITKYKKVNAGNMTLDRSGKFEVELTAKTISNIALMDLQTIEIIPAN